MRGFEQVLWAMVSMVFVMLLWGRLRRWEERRRENECLSRSFGAFPSSPLFAGEGGQQYSTSRFARGRLTQAPSVAVVAVIVANQGSPVWDPLGFRATISVLRTDHHRVRRAGYGGVLTLPILIVQMSPAVSHVLPFYNARSNISGSNHATRAA
jgi:hypothetical protein